MDEEHQKEPWRQSCLPLAPLKTARKQPASSLKAAWKQPSRDHLPLPVWFRRCIWGSYVAPVFISSVFISSPEIEKRHTQTHRPVIFSSRHKAKENGDVNILTYIPLLIGGALAFWEIECGNCGGSQFLLPAIKVSAIHFCPWLVTTNKKKKRCTPLFWASTTPSFYFQIRPRWWLKLRQRVGIVSIRCSRWANLWKIMLVVPRQQLGCYTTVRMNWGNCRCQ